MTALQKTIPAVVLAMIAGVIFLRLQHVTLYCPLNHWISDFAICVVKDNSGDRILIQHVELDLDVHYLEVRERRESSYYKFPVDYVAQVGPGDYEAKFDQSNDSMLIVEGHSFELVATQPWW